MNLDDWHAYLASAPATPNQVGRLHREAERLGLADRAERLAILAALAGLENLDSTRDLTMGDAGRLVRILADAGDRDELPAAAAIVDEGQDGEQRGGPTLLQVITAALVQLYAEVAASRYRESAQKTAPLAHHTST